MKVTLIQQDTRFADPDYNFTHISALIEEAVKAESPDVIVLPETFNTGFFPRENLASFADDDGKRTRETIGALAKKHGVNVVAGSVANRRADGVYNTALVFDREGNEIASYDKTHLFTPSGEDDFFVKGDHLTSFTLDGAKCGLIICYDIRFPELTRTLALGGMDVLFVVAQWPEPRIAHLLALSKARAIENQAFVVCCNSCGKAGGTQNGGHSSVHDPWGALLAVAGAGEEILSAACDLTVLSGIRESINVFRDRRPALYRLGAAPEDI
ncbi:MAG: carbon-nitrogen family hydrolase [Clostridia bacterium]|nr:carbon-nitrogen family hydrolase [Clostridia bacterium]